ncbi:tRNA (uridine(54)-C5)-methyltransferase TrmA [Gilliamella apis]|uniref:tRNA/tmRNA (uracil-C(5))-methyltransferase n=1 Tax=Gilliamella apis TaxID=1970738 RepID=A0A242NW38_9GAMM|nr:tRNA (uridine(54)-C5)-methyltransferase TrmA [Gilliamella apis]KES16004.1 SAM-dependent methyltransferase related to tRNA (uracil-5-)-methyltransferase [Gilliamella apis SCGC AB-598-P17]OCG06065.1 tRNA (uridine(54)-C5)-methyltransferase TrmA [Gilliamella apis]OTQ51217.1 tRNA (uridine(54)-C5)-methyltransferase TrmA [Gilliamella apis]PXY93876.1 tRNA (uridine(54)-C5)-methyltransferase TrmA [Gilliamella apis]WLS95648.1 tRNA (uridine(54)-C5)-methyltransferase TrmA [Gilliamella apis]
MTESFSNDKYNQQLQNKITNLKILLSDFSLPDLQVFSSPISHYRMRAEFRIWHNGEELYHIMYDKKTKKRVRIDSFPIASQLINRAMQTILPLLQYNDKLRHQLFQIDYFSTLSGQLLITLLYHKKLDDQWIIEAERLKQQLAEQGIIANLVGRASNQKIAVNVDYVDEVLPIFDKNFSYRQVENSFTQPNAAINIKMLEWAISVTKDSKGDLLEFYCGNGNFSIALAQNFRKVLATEIAKASVYSAQHNIKINNIDNLIIARLSAEEFTSAIKKERQFNRLQGINLDDYQCQTVLVDPPRAGLDDNTLEIIQSYQRIIYISCNPNTLKNNLEQLTKTHHIEHFAMFDQFPYTDHIETGIVLRKN